MANDLSIARPADTLPALIDKATAALESARTSGEVLEARDLARVAYDAAKSAGRMAKAKNAHDNLIADVHRAQAHALSIRARAEMRLAEEYDAAQARGEVFGAHNGARNRVESSNAIAATADLGLRRDEIYEARQFRKAEEESPGIVQSAIDQMVERGEEPSRAGLKREVTNHLAMGTGQNEWYTPQEFVEKAFAVMGGIDLDPASSDEANQTVKATQYFTESDDGLSKAWCGRVWLNPPYSRDLMPKFCEKLASHVDAGEVSSAILVAHNNTDTGWFHRLSQSCAAACFPSKRIRFYRGKDVAAPVNGQVFFYFGEDVSAFKSEFQSIGWVVVPA